jgi:hypothetical protein
MLKILTFLVFYKEVTALKKNEKNLWNSKPHVPKHFIEKTGINPNLELKTNAKALFIKISRIKSPLCAYTAPDKREFFYKKQ